MGRILRSGGGEYSGPGIEVTREQLAQEQLRAESELMREHAVYWFPTAVGATPPLEHLRSLLPARESDISLTIVEATSVQDAERLAQQGGVVVLYDGHADRHVATNIIDILEERAFTEDIAPTAVIVPPEGMPIERIHLWFANLFVETAA